MGATQQAQRGNRLGTSRYRAFASKMRVVTSRWLSAVLLAVIVVVAPAGVGAASADPAPAAPGGSDITNGGKLPGDFPADLRKYVGGTDEFKGAEWFAGPCKDKGGDIGSYLNATFPVEGRLLYWSQSEEDRKTKGADKKELPSFPSGDSQFFLPTGMCAADMAQWGIKAWTVWGFNFADTPDKESTALIFGSIDPDLKGKSPTEQAAILDQKMKLGNGGNGYPYNKLFEQFSKEKTTGVYRGHAFFLNCEAGTNAARKAECQNWNLKVGNLILGTYNWIEKNKGVGDRVNEAFSTAAKNAQSIPGVQAWNVLYQAGAGIVKFVQDPTGAADDWANKFKEWAMDLTPEILQGLATVGRFNFTEPGFVQWYILSITLGWLVLALMLLITVVQGNSEKLPMSDVMKSFFAYTPGTLFAMAALPLLLATFVVPAANALTDNLSTVLGTSTQQTINSLNEMFQGLNQKTLVGGTISGLIGFGAMGLGAVGMYLGFVMHYMAVPLGTMAAGMALGMYVNPQMRAKALRPLLALIAVIFSKPLLFLLLGAIFWLLRLTAQSSVAGDGRVQSFGALVFVALCFLTLGASPFAALKWAPILPSPEDAPGYSSQGGTAGGAAIGAAVGSVAMRRAQTPVHSGGGGGSSGAGGAAGVPGSSGPGSGSGKSGTTQAQSQATTPTVGASGTGGTSSKGNGSSGRVGSHASSFLSAAKGTTRAVGGHLGVAAVAAGSAVGAGAKKASADIHSANARGEA